MTDTNTSMNLNKDNFFNDKENLRDLLLQSINTYGFRCEYNLFVINNFEKIKIHECYLKMQYDTHIPNIGVIDIDFIPQPTNIFGLNVINISNKNYSLHIKSSSLTNDYIFDEYVVSLALDRVCSETIAILESGNALKVKEHVQYLTEKATVNNVARFTRWRIVQEMITISFLNNEQNNGKIVKNIDGCEVLIYDKKCKEYLELDKPIAFFVDVCLPIDDESYGKMIHMGVNAYVVIFKDNNLDNFIKTIMDKSADNIFARNNQVVNSESIVYKGKVYILLN